MSRRCSCDVSRLSSIAQRATTMPEHADRDVHEEDPAPVDVVGDQPTEQRADGERHRRDAGPDADRHPPLTRRERRGDYPQRRRVHDRRAEPLNRAGADQEVGARREAAGERRQREDRQADDEQPAPAEVVGELSAREHERRERQRIGDDDPLELRLIGIERPLNGRQRDVHDRVVEHDHEQPEGDGHERPPLAILSREEVCRDSRSHRRKLASTSLAVQGPPTRLAADAPKCWEPDAETLERANVVRLMRRHGFDDYRELVQRSIDEPEWFWAAAVEDLGIEFAEPWKQVLDSSRGPEWTTWFVGGKLNIAWNCVHRWARERSAETAAVFRGEDGARRELSFGELSSQVTKLAEALVRLGVEPGDRVAIYLPMSPEVAIASHACAHIGAVQVPIFSGFAAPAVAQRLADSEAKVAITVESSLRRGREIPMLASLEEARREAPSLEHVVLAPFDELLADCPGELEPLAVDSEHPYLLTYTSGTTGRPKGVLHVQGGFLVSIAREVGYQADARPGDVIHFATDMGWIMGPWTVVGGGAMGATIVYAEGAPDWPPDRLWQLIDEERVSILGCSPTLIRALVPHGEPEQDLSSLRIIVTTGEPWNPDPYRWLFEHIGGGRCPIINCSGGTEVGACFLSPTPAIPIKECSVGVPATGMAMDVVDDDGRSLAATGEVGELVCRKPFPGMTRGFWRDDERYLETYWRRFPGIWTHGDWASVDEDGYWFLHGRSDDTLNVAGKRIGPAELESAAVAHPAVLEAAAVGIPHDVKGEVAWVFCVPVPGEEGCESLALAVKALIAADLGKAFAPERIVFVPALPKTRSAKIVRRAVRAAALGDDPGDMSSVENPEAVAEIARAL